MELSDRQNKAIIGIIVVVLLVAATTAAIVWSTGKSEGDTSTTATASVAPSTSSSVSSNTSTETSSSTTFKDGTYSATGSYQTPGGSESISVTVMLSSGAITDVSVTQHATRGEAEEYQSAFASAFKSQVVGKKVSDVSLSRVAGSSLTPIGFNNAIDDIEQQAAA